MKHSLVGYTGFVGQNLAAVHSFDHLYNSRNITEAFGRKNGLVVYSGVPSEKYLANTAPTADHAAMEAALANMESMRPERLVLISTVDVYPCPRGVDENTAIAPGEEAYGRNRLWLEEQVRARWPDALVVRLPALFGKGLKKNFVYDMLTISPAMLKEEKYWELAGQSPLVEESYLPAQNGFYRRRELPREKRLALRAFFAQNRFNALCFTDSRSRFQFYPLKALWGHIELLLGRECLLANMATQPISAAELYAEVYGKPFENHTARGPAEYDMKTCLYALYGSKAPGYVFGKEYVLPELKAFIRASEQGR